MKLTFILLLLAIIQVSANTYAQKVTLQAKNAFLEDLIIEIQKQSGYDFVYNSDLLKSAKPINISLKNAGINVIMNKCVSGQPFTYVINNKTITIKPLEKVQLTVENRDVIIVGKITDEQNLPLPGVIVQIKNSDVKTVSDNQGNYKITSVDQKDILVFRFIGYETYESPVVGRNIINIVLKASSQGLEQVVVVGYGTQKKATVTGAIASIDTKEIKQSPASNLAVTLAGRLPGLTSIQRSGEPGREGAQLFIRGLGTINEQSPIILVDGVERDLNYIDPNEVESVTILKDASSTAIFGVRGANGVILVTTRRGSTEKPEISFTSELSAQDFTRSPKPVNSFDYARLRNLALQNDGLPYQYTAEEIEKYRSGSDPERYPNTSWHSLLLNDYAYQKRHNLNVSGANNGFKYFVNAGFLGQDGQFKTEDDLSYDPKFKLERYNFRSNIDMQLSKSLKAFLNVAGYLEKTNSPASVYSYGIDPGRIGSDSPSLWIMAYLNDLNATVPGPNTPSGGVITIDGVPFPSYGQINRTGYINRASSNVTATYGMELDLGFITKGLSAKGIISYDTKAINNFFAMKAYPRFIQVVDRNNMGSDGLPLISYKPYDATKDTPLALSSSRQYSTRTNAQAYLNYNRTFNGHKIGALFLYQQEKTIINGDLPYNLRGVSSRISYAYKNKYFLEFNAGYNGSEQFAKGKRFGFFPALSGGWLISKENFLTENNVLNHLKLRGSYGYVGNDRIGGRRFLYLDNIQVGGGGNASLGNSQTISVNSLRNEELTWELAKKTNIGFEMGLFNSFNLIVDLFNERRDNILRNRGTIPTLIGISSSTLPPANIGVIENKGYEIEINYKKAINSDLSILSKLNLNYAKNKQVFADEVLLPNDYAYQYRETGYTIGQPFGFIADGFFANQADVNNSPKQNVGGHVSRPGDLKFKDLNGDGVVDSKDVAPIGYSSVPEYTFGGALNVTYKRFDISALFQGVTNVSNFYRNRNIFPKTNFYSQHLQSWTQERADNGETITYPRLTTEANPNENNSTYFNLDASYLRLKNVEIGYSLPKSITKKVGAQSARLYLNGFNLFTWDRLPTKNFDPEISDNLAEGYSYPVVRFYNIGVNIIF